MIRLTALAAAVLVLVGCSAREAATLGSAVVGTPVPVASSQAIAVESTVVLKGTMTRKCPVAGCWFLLQDETGTIKVDTKNAGFVVVDVPLNTAMTVAGRVVTNGNERLIDATGIQY